MEALTMPEKVLVVTHETALSDFVVQALQDAGYDSIAENSSLGAMNKAEEFQPKLLIIDPVMGAIAGTQAAKWIAYRTGCDVLFLSGAAVEGFFAEVVEELRREGCNCDAFPLPVEKHELLLQVKNQIGRRITRQ